MLRLLTVVILACLLAGCASGSRVIESGEDAGLIPPPFLLELPVDLPRLASAPAYLSVLGDAPYMQSDNAMAADSQLQLPAEANELEYGIYQLSTSGHPLLSIEVNLSIFSGEGCWLAIANYDSGLWDFIGPIASGTYVNNEPDPGWASPGNDIYIAVIAFNSTIVWVDRVLIAIDIPVWQKHTIDGAPQCGRWNSLAELGGVPAVAYLDDIESMLRYAVADTAMPAATGDWTAMTVDEGDGGMMVVGSQASLAIVGGKPLIAHTSPLDYVLRVTATDEDAPDELADWNSYVLDVLPHQSRGCLSLASVNGLPAVTYYVQYAGPEYRLRYAYASQAAPALEHWTLTDGYMPSHDFRKLSLADIGGKPGVAFYLASSQEDLLYASSNTATPASIADWQGHTIADEGEPGVSCALVSLGGRPAIGWLNTTLEDIAFAQADSAAPLATADWSHSSINSVPAEDDAFDMAVVSGRPCVIYWDTVSDELWCAWAKTSAPSQPADWDCNLVDSGFSTTYGHVSLAAIGGLPAITYYDGDDQELKYAHQLP